MNGYSGFGLSIVFVGLLVAGCGTSPNQPQKSQKSLQRSSNFASHPMPKATKAPQAITPAFAILAPGKRAILQETQNGRTVICNSADRWIVYDNDDVNACGTERAGQVVNILQIGKDSQHMKLLNTPDPLVEVQAIDGSWSGWTDTTMLAPQLPQGLAVTLRRAKGDVIAPQITAKVADENGESAGDNADAMVLSQDGGPHGTGFDLVRVTSGPKSGVRGWVLASSVYPRGSTVSVGSFTLVDTVPALHNAPPTLYPYPYVESAVKVDFWLAEGAMCSALQIAAQAIVDAQDNGGDPESSDVATAIDSRHEELLRGTRIAVEGHVNWSCPPATTTFQMTKVLTSDDREGYILSGSLAKS